MAKKETLLELVKNGSDVIIVHTVPREFLFELGAAAKASGAKVTVPATYPAEVVIDLSRQYGKSVAFVDGLADFKKD